MSDENWVRNSFERFGSSSELTLIEGVMGLFDGLGNTEIGSTASIAKHLKTPIVLIVDANGQAASIAALIKGFRDHDPDIELAGVVLNKVNTSRHKELLSDVLSKIEVKMLGCLPNNPDLKLSSKNLGLIPVKDIKNLELKIKIWASMAESYLDLEIFEKFLSSPKSSSNSLEKYFFNKESKINLDPCPIAIAKDNAFHFLYPEINDCLKALNMPVLPWNLLGNERIPKEAKGVIIPGGFPEEYAQEISECEISIKEIRNNFGKIPIYAECGGMLFLGETITADNKKKYSMAGILPINAKKGLLKIGYRKLTGLEDSLIIKKGEIFMGHEFHKWELIPNKNQLIFKDDMKNPWEVKGWKTKIIKEGWSNKKFHASWMHLNWACNANITKRLRKAALSTIK